MFIHCQIPKKPANEFKKFLEVYKSQDSVKLYEILQTELADDAIFEVNLLTKRNADWIPKIEKAVKKKSSFIAVGSGHLGGKNGVLNLLTEKGYRLKPIRL